MTIFIITAIALTLLVLIALLRPLLQLPRSQQPQNPVGDRESDNIRFAKQRLGELKEQNESGVLNDADYAELRAEIETTLAKDIDLDENAAASQEQPATKSNSILIAALCSLLPISALLIYLWVGTPQALNPDNVRVAQPTPNANLKENEIRSMVTKLQQRLQEQPNDPQGWKILARTLLATGQYRESIEANKKLLEINGENPDTYAAMADASAVLDGGEIKGQALGYVQQALKLDPLHPQSLWLAGLAAAQQGDSETAVSYWNKLMPLLADAPEQQKELASIIEQTKNADSATATNQTQATPKGITVKVSLSDEVKNQVAQDDVVFVVAKATQGPPAPLAVKRLFVKDLPTQITLTDADGMIPQHKLSNADQITVVARVAKSGKPVAQSGDIESAKIDTNRSATAALELVISNTLR